MVATRGVSGFAAAENDVRQPGDHHAGWNAASYARMVRLHGRKDPNKFKEGACEDTQYGGRRAVALSILDPDNPYRYIQIRGRVGRVTEEGAAAHIDFLAKKYLGKDKYPWGEPGDVRVTFEIEPTAVQVLG